MPVLVSSVPYTPAEPVTEVLHGISITDPYRWLEDPGFLAHARLDRRTNALCPIFLDSIAGRHYERLRRRRPELQPPAHPQDDRSAAGGQQIRSSYLSRLQQFSRAFPVLPLGERVEPLTDRMAFLCDQLQLPE
jgi:hypothetical protein